MSNNPKNRGEQMNILFINNRHHASEKQNEMMGLAFIPTHHIHSMTKCECCKYFGDSSVCIKHNIILAQDTIDCDQSDAREDIYNTISCLYEEMRECLKPYENKHEFIEKYETSTHPTAIKYRYLRSIHCNNISAGKYISINGWLNRCRNCGILIYGTHHMENSTPECMKCYHSRL